MSKSPDLLLKTICYELDETFNYVLDENKSPYIIEKATTINREAHSVESDYFKSFCFRAALDADKMPSESQFKKLKEYASAKSFLANKIIPMFHRTGPIKGGVEIDKGCSENIRYRVTPNSVEAIKAGSEVAFKRSAAMLPLPDLAEDGDVEELKEFTTFELKTFWLFAGLLTYWLAHSKEDSTSFPHLALIADQGSGKTFLCKVVIRGLVDPSSYGVQTFPDSKQDFVLASQNVHVQIYDNVTYLSLSWANILCILATGGNLGKRKLYFNSSVVNHKVHGPCVLNGLANFIPSSDLAQRVMMLELPPLEAKNRRSEREMMAAFDESKPRIFRGMLNLISEIMAVDDVKVIYKERMLDFSTWLAKIEVVRDFTPGILQEAYHDLLVESQVDSVMGDQLAYAAYQLVTGTNKDSWSGTANELLHELNTSMNIDCGNTRSKGWPSNAIALSKRLRTAKAGLLVQGVEVTFTRGKKRIIEIVNLEAY